ncbi:tryptophan synthase subunit alpha [Candidatus Carsonella ruddii]|uniref:tryptophan synthase n=1 Tax=Carsonella ruddii TaxID=114186 RepID=A0A1U9RRM7_CARRU|nr:tryptophan synthase subunit alpha [Candidatus Carsonella ruddii]AQU89547.1 Tryptophan synthase alpha chain [Candidatus Carsonella ruddii]
MKKIIFFIPLNYPNKLFFFNFIKKIPKYGTDFIEIGLPNIDSIADGNIVYDSNKYIVNNYSVKKYLNIIFNFKLLNNINLLILMSYYNSVFKYGEFNFSYLLNIIKIDSILLIDYNLECNINLYFLVKKKKINFINFITSNISKKKKNFLNNFFINYNYFSYIKGITGDKKIKINYLNNYINKIKNNFIFGFGLSNIKLLLFIKKIKNFVFGSFVIYLINKYYYNYKKIFKIIKIMSIIIKNK